MTTSANKKNVFGENMGTSGFIELLHLCTGLFMQREYHFLRTPPVPSGRQLPALSPPTVPSSRTAAFRFSGYLYTYSKQSRQYYEDCYIEGTVDFIFGWSTAVLTVVTFTANGRLCDRTFYRPREKVWLRLL